MECHSMIGIVIRSTFNRIGCETILKNFQNQISPSKL